MGRRPKDTTPERFETLTGILESEVVPSPSGPVPAQTTEPARTGFAADPRTASTPKVNMNLSNNLRPADIFRGKSVFFVLMVAIVSALVFAPACNNAKIPYPYSANAVNNIRSESVPVKRGT
jgi:hypothetical protein